MRNLRNRERPGMPQCRYSPRLTLKICVSTKSTSRNGLQPIPQLASKQFALGRTLKRIVRKRTQHFLEVALGPIIGVRLFAVYDYSQVAPYQPNCEAVACWSLGRSSEEQTDVPCFNMPSHRNKRRDLSFFAWYTFSMNPESSVIDRLIDPVGQCLTPEVAQRIASLQADDKLQARVDELADKANAGTLTDDERSQYEQYVSFSQFVTLLQIKARNLVDRTTGAN